MARPDIVDIMRSLEPQVRQGEVVFAIGDGLPPEVEVLASVREPEGLSVVMSRAEADARGISYDFVGAWITLSVDSALDLVGLTAAVSGALANASIPCNVIAGLRHDHLVVPVHRADDALTILRRLAAQPRRR
ncbi:ACT domain-containing protein [Homoserinibacter sp. YIM 151385]|uniref:ACT domain-containing protein n=1 Tax=Homoserinibacter sp. YIM 151385 TaxID=2985506 RepID=UPI0022F0464F|nr:ACT domain-containing protein [Homoserinibacter sp. YIM 151385]WBU37067.1 ACT domain-containing protein [Homoserinibacter sp. YIM 151385]